jgi:hypothetical protein
MARLFFAGHEYSQYVQSGGLPFKEDIFYQCKCECIEQSKFEECSCPICTVARETIRDWDRQRTGWFKEAGSTCSCGHCAAGSPYRLASRSFASLRAFLHAPCGKQSLDELLIAKGPKSCEKVKMYRRQCCRVPLPEIADALKAVAASDDAAATLAAQCAAKASKPDVATAQKAASAAHAKATAAAASAGGYTIDEIRALADCDKCGLAVCMPRCPVEWDDAKPASYKKWCPIPATDGKSYRMELRKIDCTRKELMERIQAVYTDGDPHQWIDNWQTHHRHLTYATFGDDEMCISTDFSAQFDHKCAWTLTCEHPPRSNQAVYVVTHSPRIDEHGARSVTTDIWRIFSEVKGDALFHNTALSQIVKYYKERLGLKQVHVFTDGCRGQYKGKRNFHRIASFPSKPEHKGVRLLHHFAAGHHFKGPHDAYGKDPKFLGRMAERQQRVRLATTRDLYNFCVETMPEPKKLMSKEIIAKLSVKPAAEVARLPPEQLPEHLRRQQTGAVEGELTAAADEDALMEEEAAGDAAMEVADDTSDAGAPEMWDEEHLEGFDDECECLQPEAERPEAASDSEEEEDGAGDFEPEFDAVGARIRPEEEAAQQAALAAEAEVRSAVIQQAPTRQRRSRCIEVLQQAAGQEQTSAGETRHEQQGQRTPGIFTAAKYFWMYYAPGPQRDLKIVKPGEVAGPGECHAVLDAAANVDADSVTDSNSTYEYAGIDAQQPELLYTKTFTCSCATCCDRSSIHLDFRSCPFAAFTGRWQQQTVHKMHSVAQVAAEKRVDGTATAIQPQGFRFCLCESGRVS